MTLDVKKLLVNIIKKQMQIQHMSAPVDVFKKEHLPEKIASKIAAEFGEDYLLDSNMIVFYRGEFSKDQVEKLFSITNKAFGEDANRMTLGDFKKFSLDADGPVPQPGDDSKEDSKDDEDSESSAEGTESDSASSSEQAAQAGSQDTSEQPAEDASSEKASAEKPEEGSSSQAEGAGSEEDEEDKQLDKEVDEIVNGGSDDQVNEDDTAAAMPQQEAPAAPPSNVYLFLKITTK